MKNEKRNLLTIVSLTDPNQLPICRYWYQLRAVEDIYGLAGLGKLDLDTLFFKNNCAVRLFEKSNGVDPCYIVVQFVKLLKVGNHLVGARFETDYNKTFSDNLVAAQTYALNTLDKLG